MNILRFLFLSILKTAGCVIYPSRMTWLSDPPADWKQVRVILILNHTSLFEFVLGVMLPFKMLWEISRHLIIGVADVTLRKTAAGFVFRNLAPKTVPLTRKRDQSWQNFLEATEPDDLCIFMPEGQMKRKNGLDKFGKTLTVKPGVYDLLMKFTHKKMMIVYSGGLHHVMAPGQRVPGIFKKIAAKAEVVDTESFLRTYAVGENPAQSLASELQRRRDRHLV